MGIWYCTREDVKAALDVKNTARMDAQIDRAIESGSRSIEGLTHRIFYPVVDVRYKDWPNAQTAVPWRVWLDADEVISVTELSAGEVVIPDTDYFLEPSNSGPPYSRIDLDLDGPATWGGGPTHQREIRISGVFGHDLGETLGAALAASLDTASASLDVSDSAALGVGAIARIGSERLIVTGKSQLDTGRDIATGGDLAAQANDVIVAATDASDLHEGETILIDAERMLILDIAGNNLIVKRAWDGSVLAAHAAGADIYAPRRLSVVRGALGTTAASHNAAADIYRHDFPAPIRTLAVAEAVTTVSQETAGYARVVGGGDNQFEASGKGLRILREDVYTRYGRKARIRAV